MRVWACKIYHSPADINKPMFSFLTESFKPNCGVPFLSPLVFQLVSACGESAPYLKYAWRCKRNE